MWKAVQAINKHFSIHGVTHRVHKIRREQPSITQLHSPTTGLLLCRHTSDHSPIACLFYQRKSYVEEKSELFLACLSGLVVTTLALPQEPVIDNSTIRRLISCPRDTNTHSFKFLDKTCSWVSLGAPYTLLFATKAFTSFSFSCSRAEATSLITSFLFVQEKNDDLETRQRAHSRLNGNLRLLGLYELTYQFPLCLLYPEGAKAQESLFLFPFASLLVLFTKSQVLFNKIPVGSTSKLYLLF